MKAILSKAPGGPETLVLADIAEPVAGPGQVVVRVAAVGVNYPDSLIIADAYQVRPPRPFSPGAEFAGVVENVGAGVTDLRAGDRVLAIRLWGGMAQRVAVEAWRCIPIPAAMPFDDAAAFMLTYGTSYHALKERAGLRPGETLLVLGASGGVGLAAVELGTALGARVVAAASSADKVALALGKGADAGVVYDAGLAEGEAQRALSRQFKTVLGDNGADVVFDPVGGSLSEPALRATAWRGRYLVVGFPAGIPRIALNLPLLKGCDILGVFWGAAIERDPAGHRLATLELLDLYSRGVVRPTITARYPLQAAPQAIADLAARRAMGKLVVMLDSGD